MTEIGEYGRNCYNQKTIYVKCPECDYTRWVLLRNGEPIHTLCHSCARKKSNGTFSFERFWKHVNKNGCIKSLELGNCWEWIGRKTKDGYGRYRIDYSEVMAHRYSYKLVHVDYDMSYDYNILHKCDNPSCVRPEHLFIGTQSENILDSYHKGRRTQIGESNADAILKESDVLEIRKRYKSGESISKIHLDYEKLVTFYNIRAVCYNQSWKHLL
jgi:hypothetical protein